MAKRIIGILFFISLLAGILYVYFYFEINRTPLEDPLKFIPENAAMIIKVNDSEAFLNRLRNGNLIWEELRSQTEIFKQSDEQISLLDSIRKKHKDIDMALEKKPVYISVLMTGANKFSYLYSFDLSYVNGEHFEDLIKELFDDPLVSQRTFEGASLKTVKYAKGEFHYAISQGVFICSESSILIENSLSQYAKGTSLYDHSEFITVLNTAGTKVLANVYIDFHQLAGVTSVFADTEQKEIINIIKNLASKASLDLNIKSNALVLNGFSISNDTLNQYLNLFLKQKPQEAEVLKIVPSQVSYFLFQGFSNFSAFLTENKKFSGISVKKEVVAENQNELSLNELESIFLSWVSNEALILKVKEKPFLVFKTVNKEASSASLAKIATGANEPYKDFDLSVLNVHNPFEQLLGPMYSQVSSPHCFTIGRYVVFANNFDDLKFFIDEFEAERTLTKDPYFTAFSENLTNESNLFFYYNISQNGEHLASVLKEQYSKYVQQHSDWIKRFEAFAFQISSNDLLFYNNIFLKYNPVQKQETTSLWELQLDTLFSSKPQIVINHNNKQKEIFIQDDANTIYLISNTGKILWKKKLDGKIMGEIQQVDALRNNKLQYLFNTKDKIYLIDRNGNFVDKFPVKLKAEASSPLAVLDYDINKQYRILIPCADNKIYNYTLTGELLKGWNIPEMDSPAATYVHYERIGDKDYLITIDIKGRVYVFDRKGDLRLTLKERITGTEKANYFIDKGKDLSKTYIITTDTSGNILRLNLNDELEKISIKEYSRNHLFDYMDINNDKVKEFIFIDDNKMNVFSADKEQVFSLESKNKIKHLPLHLLFPDNTRKMGITDPASEEAFIYDEYGNLLNDFPLRGSSLFTVTDINSDRKLNLIIGLGKTLYLYELKHSH
jgi:outer membrane protein assembly factor BamB